MFAELRKWWIALRAPSAEQVHQRVEIIRDELGWYKSGLPHDRMTEEQRAIASARAASKGPGVSRPTWRDQIAMAAVPALVARHRADVPWHKIAPIAYQIADAVMEEAKKK